MEIELIKIVSAWNSSRKKKENRTLYLLTEEAFIEKESDETKTQNNLQNTTQIQFR